MSIIQQHVINLFLLRIKNPLQSYQYGIGNQITFTFFSVESTNPRVLLTASSASSSRTCESQNNALGTEHLVDAAKFLPAVFSVEAVDLEMLLVR